MGADAIVGIEEVADTQILHNVPRTSTVPEPQEGILILSTSDPSQLEVTATPVTTDAPQPEVKREVVSSGSTPARRRQEGTLTGTPWSQRRLAQRQKRKRTLVKQCMDRWKKLRDNFRKAYYNRKGKNGDGATTSKLIKFDKELPLLIPFFSQSEPNI